MFATIEHVPLAAASIGQTYRAQLITGEEVVVKVQRPDIADTMDRDLAALALVAGLVQRRTRFGRSLRTGDVLEQFGVGLRAELDFRREADTMVEMAAPHGRHVGRAHRQGAPAAVHVTRARPGALRRADRH